MSEMTKIYLTGVGIFLGLLGFTVYLMDHHQKIIDTHQQAHQQ